jgi:hypothetical protein
MLEYRKTMLQMEHSCMDAEISTLVLVRPMSVAHEHFMLHEMLFLKVNIPRARLGA